MGFVKYNFFAETFFPNDSIVLKNNRKGKEQITPLNTVFQKICI